MRKRLFAATLALAALAAVPGQAQQAVIGQVQTFAFNFCPQGWLPADGRLLPIMQYQALFGLLATTYGGNGQTTFALPNVVIKTSPPQPPTTLTTCIAVTGAAEPVRVGAKPH